MCAKSITQLKNEEAFISKKCGMDKDLNNIRWCCIKFTLRLED